MYLKKNLNLPFNKTQIPIKSGGEVGKDKTLPIIPKESL